MFPDLHSCSKCGKQHSRSGQRYCTDCHAAYMREHRRRHAELTPEARAKSNARAYANEYQRRGKLVPRPCETCGDPEAQKHHDDYAKPLEVRWMCRKCHLDHHREIHSGSTT